MNIFRNGAEAMQEANVARPQFVLNLFHDAVLNRVCIEIEDNGPGIDEKIAGEYLNPFSPPKQ